jgi:DNA-binding MarR family transcriptional regulator
MTLASSEPQGARRGAPAATKERLRLWLRLLRASRGIEAELRERLRVTYDLTLPQFDVLAALARREAGITMTELSRYLMVSNGNVTGIVARLVEGGLVERAEIPGDRRSTLVRLTRRGATEFATMAAVHEGWVDDLLGEFSKAEAAQMIDQLDGLVDRLRGREPRNGKVRQERSGK